MFQSTYLSKEGKNSKSSSQAGGKESSNINLDKMMKGHENAINTGKQPVQKMVKEEEEPKQGKLDGSNPAQMMVKEEEETKQKKVAQKQSSEEEELVQGKALSGGISGNSTQDSSGNSSGSSLPVDVQSKMENSFGTSFADVNIHKNDESATNMGALAYTQGSDVHFAPGQFSPNTQSGQELIGHELTHVVQQREGRVKPTKQGKGMAVNDSPALENEADAMGKKAAEGKSVDVAGTGSGIQRQAGEDEKVLQDIQDRSRGVDRQYDNTAKGDENLATETADRYFLDAYGEYNFAENILQDLNADIEEVYTNITEGNLAAIAEIQSSVDREREKQEFAMSCIFALSTVLIAWIPVASAAVAATEKRIFEEIAKTLHPQARLTSIKIPKYAQVIKALGQTKLPDAINKTVKNIYGLLDRSPASIGGSIKSEMGALSDMSRHSAYASVLEIAMSLKDDPKQELHHSTVASLKTQCYSEIMLALFPNYHTLIMNRNFTGIMGQAKTELLKNVILNNGRVHEKVNFADKDKIEGTGDRYSTTPDITEHALNAMGGEEAFADSLKHPNEFVYASLNASLKEKGLELNEGDLFEQKATETDFLDNLSYGYSNYGISVNILDPEKFKNDISSHQGPLSNSKNFVEGPIKEIQEAHTFESGGVLGSGPHKNYKFDYTGLNISDVRVFIDPGFFKSMLDGRVKSIGRYYLRFNASGNVNIFEETIAQWGRSQKLHKTEAISGYNKCITS